MRRVSTYDLRRGYPRRILLSLACTLLLAIALVKWWPASEGTSEPLRYGGRTQERIQMTEVVPSTQKLKRPPPPAPLLPVVVPDEIVLDEVEIDLSDENLLALSDFSDDDALAEGTTDGQEASAGAARAAKPVRFVEPEYTREARRKRVRAEVVVEVVVDERGRVQEARILERYLLGSDEDPKRPVETLGYGLEEAALAAARRWQFRPALQGGKAVADQTTLTFFFGV